MGRARRVPVDPPLSWIKPAVRQSDINNSRMPSKTILRVAPWISAGLALHAERASSDATGGGDVTLSFRSCSRGGGARPLEGKSSTCCTNCGSTAGEGELAIRRTYSTIAASFMAENTGTADLKEFQLHEKDTGSADVQVALRTKRIAQLTEHLRTNAKDHSSRRGLLKMVAQRRSLLDYLSRSKSDRYKKLIDKLKLRKWL